MRFSVKCAFPHLGKRGVASRKSAFWQVSSRKSAVWLAPPGRTSRKGAFWLGRHLQNASLREAPHQKAHSGGSGARRMRLYVTSNPRMCFSVKCAFPHLGKRGVASRKSAFCHLRLTEKRSLWLRRDGKAQSGPRPQGTPHGKAHSARWASRKSAVWSVPPEHTSRKSALCI